MAWLNGVVLVYAILMLGGGVGAYFMTANHEIKSLVAGVASCALLLASLAWAKTSPRMGYGLATLVTLGLLVLFALRFLETRKVMPSLGLAGLSAVVLLCLIAGHFAMRGDQATARETSRSAE